MSKLNQSPQEASRSQEFQNNLRLLDGISSWHVWTGGLLILLLPVSVVLLFNVTPSVIWVLRGLLALVSIISATFLYQQRLRLEFLRSSLIAQIDAAARARATADKFYGMATVDALTGLYNRRFGETRLKEEIEGAEKSGEPMILVALDFDRFKEINDTYGHAAGDLALKAFSRSLQRAIRACDVPIRVGGDEFLVIFPECPVDKISEILSRLDSIAFDFGGKQIPVTFSHGIAQYEVSDTPEKMIQRADARLYAHKQKRKSAAATEAPSRADAIETLNSVSEEPAGVHLSEKADSPKSARSEANSTAGGTNPLDLERLFRRSRRVDVDMPVNVQVHNEDKMPVVQEGKTVNVSAHGALLALNSPMTIGQKIRLVNPRTQQEIDCCVRRLVMPTPDGMVQVGVEFTAVAPTFWDIASPPWDWNAARRPAPERQHTESPENPAPGVGRDWGNDKYDARSSQPFLDPAWVPGCEAQPAQPSSRAKAASDDLWEELGRDIQEALRDVGKTLAEGRIVSKDPTAKGKLKSGPGRQQFALALALAFFSGIAVTLLVMPHKSVAQSGPAPGQDSAHSERVAEAASTMPSKSGSSGSPVEASSVGTAALAGQAEVPAEVAQGIPDLGSFKLATTEDFDPAAVSWLRTRGQQADAQIPGNYTGSGQSHAYLLRGKDKSWRVLIIGNGQVYCDVRYRNVAVAALVPKEDIHNIQWNERAAPEFDGDGLLIVGSADDPASAVMLSLHGSDVTGSHPVDYRQNPTSSN